MKIYVVIRENYDFFEIKGCFTKEEKAKKCEEYYNLVKRNSNGERVILEEVECLDDVDFEAKIREYHEEKLKEKLAEEEAVKQSEIAEYNRIKEKYGL